MNTSSYSHRHDRTLDRRSRYFLSSIYSIHSLLPICSVWDDKSGNLVIKKLFSHCVLLWRNVQVPAFDIRYFPHSNLYSRDINTLALCFSCAHWLLWECQRPHQRPLLLWCVVARPSEDPHYRLMDPHRLHSIKTQRHVVVSPGLSELRRCGDGC